MEEQYIDLIKNKIQSFISNADHNKLLYLFTPPNYGKSVRIPKILSEDIKILVVESNNLYVNYFRLMTKKIEYISSDNLWNLVIEKYDHGKCILDLDYDLIIFDDYSDSNLEFRILIKLLKGCDFHKIMLQSSNVYHPKTSIWDIEEINIPFTPFHTDIRYHDTNYKYDDAKLLRDISRLVTTFNDSTVEGNFLIILPKTFLVNKLFSLIDIKGLERADKDVKSLLLKFTHYESLTSLNEFMNKEYENPVNNIRKIVIITDVLEPLISLPRLGMIFETGYESKIENTLTGGKHKIVTSISEEKLGKYCSRLNIKFPGICFRMFTKDKLEIKKNIKTISGIFWYQILQLRSKNLESVLENINEEIMTDMINSSFESLKILNICDDYREPSCIFVNKLSLGIRNSLTLFQLLDHKKISQIVILLSFIDNYDAQFYRFPIKQKDENDTKYTLRLLQYKQDLLVKVSGYNDLDTFINIWNEYIDKVQDPWKKEIETISYINNNKLYLLLKTISQLFDLLKKEHEIKIPKKYKIDPGILIELKKVLSNNYQDKILSLDSDDNYYLDNDGHKYRLDQKFNLNLLSSKPPKSIIDLIDMHTKFEGELNFVILSIDI